MIPRVRLAISVALLLSAVTAVRLPFVPLAALAGVALAAHCFPSRYIRRLWRAEIPIVLFVATVTLLQWFHGKVDWLLPLRTVAVFLLSTLAMRVAPWAWFAAHLSPRSKLYLPGLFLLFVRHFTEILMTETQRTLQARAMCISSLFRPGGFSSLANGLAAIFRRALIRAERFYAAQTLNGIVQ